ncbi:hypothetical protein WJX84_002719 [Apatococcus fuscideae]|uniref:Small ribosomal subunit protein uS9c n=1 Tax=Apatococcus fuscideae TaxID=2026836 RepID=A0AAW1SNI4_9CHLO
MAAPTHSPHLSKCLRRVQTTMQRRRGERESRHCRRILPGNAVQVIDDLGRSYATGKRKTSVARVWLKPGTGIISVNSKGFDAHFPTIERRQDVLAPFAVTGTYGSYDVKATVRGGGTTGQAQALRHGIGKALQLYDPSLRPPLKTAGYLMRDARVVERKKPGRAKARRSLPGVLQACCPLHRKPAVRLFQTTLKLKLFSNF